MQKKEPAGQRPHRFFFLYVFLIKLPSNTDCYFNVRMEFPHEN